jgi:hypothetical protein
MAATIPSEEQVVEWMTSLSNWGRWGDDDQHGTAALAQCDGFSGQSDCFILNFKGVCYGLGI